MALSSLASVPITTLKGIGAKVAEKLAKIDIHNVEDALFHLPLRYEDRSRIYTINDSVVGTHVTVVGQVQSSQIQFGKRRSMLVRITDTTGLMTLRFFNFSAAQKNQLESGVWLRCFGEIRGGRNGPEMIHPEYKIVDPEQPISVEETLTPVYPTTEGIKQATLRSITEQALSRLEKYNVDEILPADALPNNYTIKQALSICHRPPVDTPYHLLEMGIHPAQQRLALEELVAHQVSMLEKKHVFQEVSALSFEPNIALNNQFLAQLPFTPTNAQQRVIADIYNDIKQPRPMLRLVQGDVGSGKTLVAAMAALAVIGTGNQVALMAPTEILAEQHASSFKQWLEPLSIEVVWLAGKTKAAERRIVLEKIESGSAKMVIGTHALFQESVQFYNLALVIIDEQHRFGVHQRLELRNKGAIHSEQGSFYPHQLVMTATPIPRTLAMTAYADLDCSIIDELPPGRTPVTTVAIPDTRRESVIERVKDVCITTGQQAYWVCTLVEESEVLQCQAAEDSAVELQALLPELKIGLVHGRMKSADKQSVMEQFKAGDINLLVATTVIEVGVDVPNASLMIIENPERLGLAQLHQLRGRVGRGASKSHCVLLYHAPLSDTAQKRLAVLRDSSDGFVIAQKDLEIRGAGEIIGTKQTGMADFKVADLNRDGMLIPVAMKLATHILNNQPELVAKITQRWLGEKQIYTNA
ncbi:ATP-dependent DNA helicase RecG [Psychrosphaera saromensis]|uniref:ATP-dependent DNA helicase RecG n=1 Tax=Psychrosphaera saromensis TaxID=716813 RepID=A0A2S7UTU9_9GAMM|nr:ATP-dependent DNA helicase RecG [Psychrosphaera saromensis]PQJ53159.1 ATP-dependent DNA helicase RecG [Psychrosphaera saromensis]GHB67569.1 ATP-dependent DNA helicase RecG [Psychrosphaera saromensis]GLQ15083.1 ATP-dependent DNA helicase RecG [Psychrosphaera saromensis]